MDREQPELIVGTQAKEDSETRLLSSRRLMRVDLIRIAEFEGLPDGDDQGGSAKKIAQRKRGPGEIIFAGQTIRVASCMMLCTIRAVFLGQTGVVLNGKHAGHPIHDTDNDSLEKIRVNGE
jgi:hypothetical protein